MLNLTTLDTDTLISQTLLIKHVTSLIKNARTFNLFTIMILFLMRSITVPGVPQTTDVLYTPRSLAHPVGIAIPTDQALNE